MVIRNVKIVLFFSLIVAMILPFSVMNIAHAEVSSEIRDKAKQGFDVWKELKVEKTKSKKDFKKIFELTKKFAKHVKDLNKHGVSTPEQWDKDPKYWRSINLPPMPIVENAGEHDIVSGVDLLSNTANSKIELLCNDCDLTQKLYIIAGFDYKLWGFWHTNAYADAGWKTFTHGDQRRTSFVTAENDHNEITPHITQRIAKEGIVNYDYEYDARVVTGMLESNNSYGIIAIQVTPNSLSITEDELYNIVHDTTIAYTVEINWLQ